MPKKKNKKAEMVQINAEADELQEALMAAMEQPPDLRSMMLFGEVDEEKSTDLIVGMIMLTDGTPARSHPL